MGSPSFWNSATTRAVAVVSVVGLFVVYLIRTWRRVGLETRIHNDRVKVIEAYDKQRKELSDTAIEDINAFEEEFQSKMQAIDTKEQAIILDASRSRRKLANAFNKSFGR